MSKASRARFDALKGADSIKVGDIDVTRDFKFLTNPLSGIAGDSKFMAFNTKDPSQRVLLGDPNSPQAQDIMDFLTIDGASGNISYSDLSKFIPEAKSLNDISLNDRRGIINQVFTTSVERKAEDAHREEINAKISSGELSVEEGQNLVTNFQFPTETEFTKIAQAAAKETKPTPGSGATFADRKKAQLAAQEKEARRPGSAPTYTVAGVEYDTKTGVKIRTSSSSRTSGGGSTQLSDLDAEKREELSSTLTDLRKSITSLGTPLSNPSVVDFLDAVGQPSSFANRSKLAASFGIANYSGTAAQNTQLLGLLRKQAASKVQGEISTIQDQIADIDRKANEDQRSSASNDSSASDDVEVSSAANLLEDIDEELNVGESPDTPNLVETFEEFRETEEVGELESKLNTVEAKIEQLDADFISFQESQEQRTVSFKQIGKNISRAETLYSRERRDLVAEQNAIANELNTKYAVITSVMNFTQQDFDNASKKYTADFNKAVTALNLANEEQDDKETSARANLQVIYNSILDEGVEQEDFSPSQRNLIAKLEAQSGLPTGFFDLLKTSEPAGKLLTTTTFTNASNQKVTSVVFQNEDGSLTTKNVNHGSVRVTSGDDDPFGAPSNSDKSLVVNWALRQPNFEQSDMERLETDAAFFAWALKQAKDEE